MKPFRAIRYNLAKVNLSDVVTPPYDVISPAEQEGFYQKSLHNVIRIDFGKGEAGDDDRNNRYTRAAAEFGRWLQEGILVQETQPAFYLYEQEFQVYGKRLTRRGLFGLQRLERFGEGKVLPHEKTIAGPKADRLQLMKSCAANFSSIFGIYSDGGGTIQALLAPVYQTDPLATVEQDKVTNRIWVVTEPALVSKIANLLEEKTILIADGHHRYETALTYRDWRLEQEPNSPADAPYRHVLMYLSSREEAVVLPTHRVIRRTERFDRKVIEQGLNQVATLTPLAQEPLFAKLAEPAPDGGCRFGMGYPGGEFLLVEIAGKDIPQIRALEGIPPLLRNHDVAVAHKLILEDRLGLSGPAQTDPQFVEFVKSREVALAALSDPTVQCLLLMTPPDLAHMERVAQAGLTMPPKTTYFYPKLLTGLVVNSLGLAKPDPR